MNGPSSWDWSESAIPSTVCSQCDPSMDVKIRTKPESLERRARMEDKFNICLLLEATQDSL